MKPVTDFSKVSRKDQTWVWFESFYDPSRTDGLVQKCMECVSWDGLQEAYVPPLERKHLETMKLVRTALSATSTSSHKMTIAGCFCSNRYG